MPRPRKRQTLLDLTVAPPPETEQTLAERLVPVREVAEGCLIILRCSGGVCQEMLYCPANGSGSGGIG